jgi:hypothetical protein
MQHYASHAARVPSLTGQLIPEPIIDEATYRKTVLEPIREAMTPLDPGCVLELEFLNARGAIARFDRGSIEIRVMDVQEYPGGDVAICAAVTAIVRALSEERFSSLAQQQTLGPMELRGILDLVSKDAERAVIDNPKYLAALGVNEPKRSAGQIWSALLDRVIRNDTGLSSLFAPLEIIERHGTLASRIRRALGEDFSREDCLAVYGEIADCLVQWEPFVP